MAAQTAMAVIAETLKSRGMNIKKIRFLVFMVLIPCLEKPMLFNQALKIRHHMPLPLNWRYHQLKLYFEHLINEYPWLQSVDSLLPGFWKTCHYKSKNRSILCEFVPKSVDGPACKGCRERYGIIIEALQKI